MEEEYSQEKFNPKELKQKRRRKIENKTESSVFDSQTMHVLSKMIKDEVMLSVDYPVSTGKEADVFRATLEGGEFAAVKIFRIDTSGFLNMMDYMQGDRRFDGIHGNKRSIVEEWASKEFKNLKIIQECGVRCPKPIAVKRNVLVMEFIGENGVPDSTLRQNGTENPEKDCEIILDYIKKMYVRGFVHADLSEFNILMHSPKPGEPAVPVLIDCGQGVVDSHHKFMEFVERDVKNICFCFKKFGVKKDSKKEFEAIKKAKRDSDATAEKKKEDARDAKEDARNEKGKR
ncbi:RIO-type serine/threonine-protein kinase Rio1 [Candidatus Gugararchaeum adminiculabundum]|nr:RIO-type serine/threonine-protein kinase Rio1 [Candidatus Gugararchaeum adminiculabundum]